MCERVRVSRPRSVSGLGLHRRRCSAVHGLPADPASRTTAPVRSPNRMSRRRGARPSTASLTRDTAEARRRCVCVRGGAWLLGWSDVGASAARRCRRRFQRDVAAARDFPTHPHGLPPQGPPQGLPHAKPLRPPPLWSAPLNPPPRLSRAPRNMSRESFPEHIWGACPRPRCRMRGSRRRPGTSGPPRWRPATNPNYCFCFFLRARAVLGLCFAVLWRRAPPP